MLRRFDQIKRRESHETVDASPSQSQQPGKKYGERLIAMMEENARQKRERLQKTYIDVISKKIQGDLPNLLQSNMHGIGNTDPFYKRINDIRVFFEDKARTIAQKLFSKPEEQKFLRDRAYIGANGTVVSNEEEIISRVAKDWKEKFLAKDWQIGDGKLQHDPDYYKRKNTELKQRKNIEKMQERNFLRGDPFNPSE